MDYAPRTDGPVKNGEPVASRRDAYGFDSFQFPNGLKIQVYDDGRVKVGGWHRGVQVVDVSNYAKGGSNGSAHVIMRFVDAPTATDENGV